MSRTRRVQSLRIGLLWLGLLTAVAASRPHARADAEVVEQAEGEPAGYREAVEQAVAEFGARHFEESRALFARAHALHPNARTYRGLGLTEFELRNYGACIDQLEAALRSRVRPLEGALRADTEQLLARANDFVARVRIDARPGPSRVLIDGVTVEVAHGEALLLQAGEHLLEVRAPGYEPEKRRLSVKGGETDTLTILFSRRTAEPREPGRRWLKSPWLWTTVGVVVAGAATATAVALTRDEGGSAAPYKGTSGVALAGP